jgi:membrane associated rhomboid family serine protease
MDKQLRIYTKTRLTPGLFDNFFRKHSVTAWLIGTNIGFFILSWLLLLIFGDVFFSYLALQPKLFLSGRVWTLITSMFMHVGFWHLFVNMISLFFIGTFVEKLIGRKRFFWMYMIAGIFSGLLFVCLAYFFGNTDLGARILGNPNVFAVGASGAIFAIAGLLAVLIPNLRVYVFFVIPMRMWMAMVFLLFVLWGASIGANLPIGNTAHFGGAIVGVVYAIYLRKKYPRKTQMLSRQFSS